jgi:23S rRNA (uracil1939-C5)-methyltransferase
MRPNAFLQTNTAMAERLYGLAREHAQFAGEESVYACALENAELKGISNAAFFAGEVGDVLDDLRDRAGDPDVVVVDPPRAGLSGKTLRRLAKIEAKRIVYVSCNPTTLGREREGARRRVGVQARARAAGRHVPHTPHIETVAVLSKA